MLFRIAAGDVVVHARVAPQVEQLEVARAVVAPQHPAAGADEERVGVPAPGVVALGHPAAVEEAPTIIILNTFDVTDLSLEFATANPEQQFILIDAVALFCTDKMDLEQTVKWGEDKIKAIYAKFV